MHVPTKCHNWTGHSISFVEMICFFIQMGIRLSILSPSKSAKYQSPSWITFWDILYAKASVTFLEKIRFDIHVNCLLYCLHSRQFTWNVKPYLIWKIASPGGSVWCVFDWWSGGCEVEPCWVGNILLWRLIMKYFLWSFSPYLRFKKGSCQFLAKECAQYCLTA